MSVIIYHNPKCSTSRNTLALLRERGIEPQVIEYLNAPPDRATLASLIKASGLSVRDFIRSKEALFTELGLEAANVTDDQLINAMIKHPILINRPIVRTSKGVRLCRPVEKVFEILP
jgi:arsenate reductase